MKDENVNSGNTSDFKNMDIEKICNIISQNIRKRLIEGALVNIFWFCLVIFSTVFIFNNFVYSGEPTRFPPFNIFYSWLGDRFPQNENLLTPKTFTVMLGLFFGGLVWSTVAFLQTQLEIVKMISESKEKFLNDQKPFETTITKTTQS